MSLKVTWPNNVQRCYGASFVLQKKNFLDCSRSLGFTPHIVIQEWEMCDRNIGKIYPRSIASEQ